MKKWDFRMHFHSQEEEEEEEGGKEGVGVKILAFQLCHPQGVWVIEEFPTKLGDVSQVNISHLSNAQTTQIFWNTNRISCL
jgi:hypothetical protein